MATAVLQVVAKRVGAQIEKGDCDPVATRTAMVPRGGSSVIEVALIARKSAIASVATPLCWFSLSSSTMALRPKGVAALPRPRMFAAKFITIAVIAGWSGGTLGKSRRRIGRRPRMMKRSSPPSEATRTSPRKKTIAPVRPITSSMACLASSREALETAFMRPVKAAKTTEVSTSPSQIQLSKKSPSLRVGGGSLAFARQGLAFRAGYRPRLAIAVGQRRG